MKNTNLDSLLTSWEYVIAISRWNNVVVGAPENDSQISAHSLIAAWLNDHILYLVYK